MSVSPVSPREEKNRIIGGTLYLVATPIGNLLDISDRAKKVLAEVDVIAAEDTRNTRRLLSALSLHRPMISYHKHNKRSRGEEIVARLVAGESCALVTDAGMPAISDPGADLVQLCAAHDIPVTVIPGACAAITALALSALPTDRFVFEGFLPVSGADRKERLAALTRETRTIILYEAPHKLSGTLTDLQRTLGNRKTSICRELTKINEEVWRTDLEEAKAYYTQNAPRGEYVLILEGAKNIPQMDATEENPPLTPEERVAAHEAAGLSRMDAIKTSARELGMTKSELYHQLHCTRSEEV